MKRQHKTLLYIALGAAAYFFLAKKASAATATGSTAVPMQPPPTVLPIAPAPTTAVVTAAGSLFDTLADAEGPAGGYVMFPSGSMAASTFLPFKQGPNGGLYTTWAGQVFSVGDANADGNYPAILVQ